MRSMTGYGEASHEASGITIQISSVNGRFHELNLYLDRSLSAFERLVREELKSLGRGSIRCQISISGAKQKPYRIDGELFKAVKREWWEKTRLSFNANAAVHLSSYFESKDQGLSDEEASEVEAALRETLTLAMSRFVASATTEGAGLASVLRDLCMAIAAHLKTISEAQDELQKALYTRLSEQVERLLALPDQSRLLEETSLLVVRHSVSEEIARLNLHLESFEAALAADKGGKHLDFLIQEMHRETNTIGSKNPLPHLVSDVIAMKEAIEDMREQVRNLQ